MKLKHLGPNVITLKSLLHLGQIVITFRILLRSGQNVITFRPSATIAWDVALKPYFYNLK